MGDRLDRRREPVLTLAIGLAIAAIFVAGTFTPLGIAIWVLYLGPAALTLLSRRPALPLVVGVLETGAIVAGFYLAPPGVTARLAEINRGFGVFGIWIVCISSRSVIMARLEQERQHWLQTSQMALAMAIRGVQSARGIAEKALGYLARTLDAQAAVMYGAGLGGGGGQLARLATWAVGAGAAPGVAEQIGRGEGLVGQALADGALIRVTDVPAGGLRVASGLADMRPRELLIAPTLADGVANGVLELAFTSPTSEADRTLLGRVAEVIGISLRAADHLDRVQQLLEETQRQAEELQTQQEELRVSNEQLEQQAQVLRESQGRLQLQQTELEQTNAQLEEQATELERQRQDLLDSERTLSASAVELARANRYKNEFLANMSHELRTPLNSALILAKLLADNKEGTLTPGQIRHAETIYSAGNDLLVLINDILDLAKVESGKVDLAPQIVVTAQLAEQIERTFRPLADQKRVGLRVSVRPDTPQRLFTDPQRLQQILKNLVANALKFTDTGVVSVDVAPDGAGRVSFAVTDTGIGIPADQQEIIFEAFRQADGTTNRRYGGTGLGLSISRELAHLLDGDLTVESTPGKGSTFRLRVASHLTPGAQAAEPAPAPAPTSTRARASTPARPAAQPVVVETAGLKIADDRGNRKRPGRLILVVEDDPSFARILYDLAHELDFDCVATDRADQGFDLARELGPSAILLDVHLPDASGLSLLERLKREPTTRHIPVHVVSVSDNVQHALELGAVGYAVKPVERQELAATIRRLEARMTRAVGKVLVVEDDAQLRDSLGHLLASDTVEIRAVGTVREALEAVAAGTFDCMVLDLALPDGSGYELLEKMSAGEQYSFPPVIVYTGRALSADEEQRLRAFSRSIIVKGARSPERLLDEVTLFLHQVESRLPPDRQRMLRESRNREAAFEGRRILVVEDDIRNIYALSSVLESRGATLQIARNGREALEAVQRQPAPDLVLMDIMMPEMDGLTAMREIRARPALERLPIIALTAKAMRDDRDDCLRAGANDYIPKPLDIEKLLSLCRVWLPK